MKLSLVKLHKIEVPAKKQKCFLSSAAIHEFLLIDTAAVAAFSLVDSRGAVLIRALALLTVARWNANGSRA